jgi:hypothetical protein
VINTVAGEGNMYVNMLLIMWRGINNILGRGRWYILRGAA